MSEKVQVRALAVCCYSETVKGKTEFRQLRPGEVGELSEADAQAFQEQGGVEIIPEPEPDPVPDSPTPIPIRIRNRLRPNRPWERTNKPAIRPAFVCIADLP